jgi:hypothetical protein
MASGACQLFPVFCGYGYRLHGLHVHRYYDAFALGKSVGFPFGVGPDEELLKIKGGIADSGAVDQGFHLILEVNRAEVIDLNSSDYSTDGHDVPSTRLKKKKGPGMLKIAEINSVVDMKIAVDVGETDLNRA